MNYGGDFAQALGPQVGMDSTGAANLNKCFPPCGENLRRRGPHARPERLKGRLARNIRGQISNGFKQNHFARIRYLRRLRQAVDFLQLRYDDA